MGQALVLRQFIFKDAVLRSTAVLHCEFTTITMACLEDVLEVVDLYVCTLCSLQVLQVNLYIQVLYCVSLIIINGKIYFCQERAPYVNLYNKLWRLRCEFHNNLGIWWKESYYRIYLSGIHLIVDHISQLYPIFKLYRLFQSLIKRTSCTWHVSSYDFPFVFVGLIAFFFWWTNSFRCQASRHKIVTIANLMVIVLTIARQSICP